jgi:receptor protein-tyrosine kinase
MGRILEVLRQEAPAARPGSPANPRSRDLEDTNPEIPFIEVGPKKWVEASADVLATAGAAPPDAGPVLAEVPQASEDRSPTVVRLRPAGSTGVHRIASELIAFHAPDHSLSKQYHDLAAVLAADPDSGACAAAAVLLFTAARGEAGTTTVLLNVAISAARQGHTVVVVDANPKRPAVARRLGLPEAPGLREVLTGMTSVDQALRRTEQPRLLALAAGLKPSAPARPAADSVRSVLGRLRERADLVLVDGPSWDGRAEVVLLGTTCDAVYVVLPDGEADTPEAGALCQLIPEQGGFLAGCILSRF